MQYRSLPEHLRPIADSVADFFRNDRGLRKFKAEEPIDDRIPRRPTLSAMSPDFHILCVEVSESPYPSGLDGFVLDCMKHCMPVLLYVAIPAGSGDANYKRDLAKARENGVGVIEISGSVATEVHGALSLALVGLRPIERKSFPRKYRFALSQAETTFRNGDPIKGCSLLYDEIESLSRKIARKTRDKGFWRALRPGEQAPRINFNNANWARMLRILMDHLDDRRCKYVGQPLLARVLGITTHRNDSAHKPKDKAAAIKLNRELSTRFETAVDLLADLISAAKPLRL